MFHLRDSTNQLRKIGLVPRLPGALFSNYCEIDILKFQKKLKKIQGCSQLHTL
jgi:hypothetical protein